MSSIITALKAALESEINRVAKDTFGREYSKWNKEQKRPFNYDESFRHGHEAATERLMTIVQKAVEMSDNIEHILKYADREFGWLELLDSSNKEFLNTLADASGERNKEGE